MFKKKQQKEHSVKMLRKTSHSRHKTVKRAKTCQWGKRKTYYFTSGRNISEESLKEMEKEILKPYEPALKIQSLEDAKKFWEEEKNKKVKERQANYTKHHNYKSRLQILWKSERLFVPEKVELPGGSLTDDIDPTFFKIVSGRPIKDKTKTREYLQDIRDCFLTRLKTGYYLDEILLMDERHINEKKELDRVRNNFFSCSKGFEQFLKEDHDSSWALLETAKEEGKKSKDKLEMINCFKNELKRVEADVLVVEEKWRNLRMFQKFLYIISPSEWRKVHDPYYGKEDFGVIASDPCLFDSFREFPGDKKIESDAKILKFREEVKESQPPALYFTDPRELLDILADLERNNLRAFTHSKSLDFPAEKMTADLEKVKTEFDQQQKSLEEDIKYLKELIEAEEKKSQANESKMKETVFGLFRDLITNEEYLTVTSYVEDAYEDAVAPNDSNLDLVEMIKEIELKQESLLLALDLLPNDVMIKATKNFYKAQKRELKEAKEAEKKVCSDEKTRMISHLADVNGGDLLKQVHQMEMLLKRLSKSLAYPKKGAKERKIVPRSLPPEEVMFKHKLPKILSKERRDELFFFGKTPDDVRLHKPLCL